MNRFLVTLVAATALASGSALACGDMKGAHSHDGGVITSEAPATPVASSAKSTEPPLVVKQQQPAPRKTASSGKPLPQGATLARTGS